MTEQLPTAAEQERALVGTCLVDTRTFERVLPLVSPEDLHTTQARLVYETLVRLYERGEAADMLTVTDELERTGQLDAVGGVAGVQELVLHDGSMLNAEAYARTVTTRSVQRRGIDLAERIARFCHDYDENAPDGVVSGVMHIVEDFVAENDVGERGYIDITDVMGVRYDELEQIAAGEKPPPSVPTGFTDLDNLITGFLPGDLIIVAGDTSMGKTSFALACAEHQADMGYVVAANSVEMAALKVADRVAASTAGVPQERWRQRHISHEDLVPYAEAIDRRRQASGRILIDDDASITVPDIKARVMRKNVELGRQGRSIDIVYVDYLQLLKSHTGARGRYESVGDVSHALKRLARELEVPVVALSQINRSNAGRGDKRPTKHDLRDSGNIEEDADAVILLHRPDYYEKKVLASSNGSGDGGERTEVIVDKYRDGATGVVAIQFVKELSTFKDASHKWQEKKESKIPY